MADLFTSAEKSGDPAEPPKAISVSQLSNRIHGTLEGAIGRIDVVGQINSPTLGNHWYFTLADGDAKIDCVM